MHSATLFMCKLDQIVSLGVVTDAVLAIRSRSAGDSGINWRTGDEQRDNVAYATARAIFSTFSRKPSFFTATVINPRNEASK